MEIEVCGSRLVINNNMCVQHEVCICLQCVGLWFLMMILSTKRYLTTCLKNKDFKRKRSLLNSERFVSGSVPQNSERGSHETETGCRIWWNITKNIQYTKTEEAMCDTSQGRRYLYASWLPFGYVYLMFLFFFASSLFLLLFRKSKTLISCRWSVKFILKTISLIRDKEIRRRTSQSDWRRHTMYSRINHIHNRTKNFFLSLLLFYHKNMPWSNQVSRSETLKLWSEMKRTTKKKKKRRSHQIRRWEQHDACCSLFMPFCTTYGCRGSPSASQYLSKKPHDDPAPHYLSFHSFPVDHNTLFSFTLSLYKKMDEKGNRYLLS